MKQVGIITIHNSYNYGGVLQAYATQQTLQTLGVETQFIDYSTKLSKQSKMFLLPPFSISNIKHDIRNIIFPCAFLNRKKAFERFIKENMKCTPNTYDCKNVTSILGDDYDYLVTGSDQTFNLNLGGDVEDRMPFFLPFKFRGKKLAYSASMGEKMFSFTEEQKKWMKTAFEDYDNISVREPVAADFIEKLTNTRPQVTYDPTLVLNAQEWDKVCAKDRIYKGNYIFFYTVLSAPWVVNYVKKLAHNYGLTVVAAHPQNAYERWSNFTRIAGGPEEFLNLIKNAKMVVTTSFHGTVFSIIYRKFFQSLVIGEGNRIKNLLKQAQLENRAVYKDDTSNASMEAEINWPCASNLLQQAKEVNLNYLSKTMNQ